VSAVLADRFRKFGSRLTGASETLREFAETEVSAEQRDGVFWLKLAIARFSDIKGLAGWNNELFHSYLIAVRSWMQNPCSDSENVFSRLCLWRNLDMTDPDGDLGTVDSSHPSAVLQLHLESTGFTTIP
jgi:hypothetical protein